MRVFSVGLSIKSLRVNKPIVGSFQRQKFEKDARISVHPFAAQSFCAHIFSNQLKQKWCLNCFFIRSNSANALICCFKAKNLKRVHGFSRTLLQFKTLVLSFEISLGKDNELRIFSVSLSIKSVTQSEQTYCLVVSKAKI